MSRTSMKKAAMKLTGADEEIVDIFLNTAMRSILNRRYPFKNVEDIEYEGFPKEYETTALHIAVYLINKMGAEGETVHSENGVTRHYENAFIPESMLKDILPMVKVG